MKIQTSFLFSIRELRHNYPLFLLCFLLMISIVTTGLFLVSADESLMKSFYNFTLTFGNTGSGLRVYYRGPYNTRILIEDMPFDVFFVEGCYDDGKNYIFNSTSLDNHWGSVVDIKSYVYENKNAELHVVNGKDLTLDNASERYIWVSNSICDEYGCKIGDYISHRLPNGKTYDYKIIGVFSSVSEKLGDFYLSEKPFYTDLIEEGYTRQVEFTGILSHPEEYRRIRSTLKNRQISVWTYIDDEFDMLTLIDILLKSLFVIILFSAMFVVYNTGKIIIRNRLSFIMRLRMLGARTGSIILIYIYILESIILFSFVLAYFFTHFFMIYIKNIVTNVVPEIAFISVDCINYATIGFFICSIILNMEMFVFRKQTDCGNITEIMQDD